VIASLGSWKIVDLPVVGEFQLGVLGVPLTFLWIVGLTNAFNFMDGIDGIAGGQALIAGFGWAMAGWYVDDGLVSVTGLLLAGSSLGFLGHNWPPARIFMGDVGSAFLGYTCAVLPVIAGRANPRMIVVGVLLVWPFVFDATLTMLRRLCRGENIFSAHRSHLYQRLVIVGFSHRFVSLLYAGLAIAGGILAVASVLEPPALNAGVAIILPLLCFCLWFYVARKERRRNARALSSAKV
jgi:UDP-N-acetylmuramyl pentapeptide phosphotransferase/UDP-N-acetylglucosamine-1-phosphate transferase